MRMKLCKAATLALSFAWLACRGDVGGAAATQAPSVTASPAKPGAKGARGTEAEGPFRAATFNAGLAPGLLPHTDARLDAIVEALGREEVDLLCVQEFWLDGHWERLASSLEERLPTAHRLPSDKKGAACAPEELAPIEACASRHCGKARKDEAPACLLEHCGGNLPDLSAGCLGCLTSQAGRPFSELGRACVSAEASGATGKPAAGKPRRAPTGTWAYGGSTGTGLLTRAPVLARGARVFSSPVVTRAALFARVEASGLGELDVYCTHLTADTPQLPHPAGRRWSEEHAEEVGELLAYVEETSRGRPVLLLGDLNTGPALGPRIQARAAEQYARFLAAGFSNPYAGPGAECTYCFDNPLRGGAGTRGTLIDHALLRGVAAAAKPSPFLRRLGELDVGGRPVRSGLSDHFGVAVSLERPRS